MLADRVRMGAGNLDKVVFILEINGIDYGYYIPKVDPSYSINGGEFIEITNLTGNIVPIEVYESPATMTIKNNDKTGALSLYLDSVFINVPKNSTSAPFNITPSTRIVME